jgi:ubiquinone biosynthesis protein COQ9
MKKKRRPSTVAGIDKKRQKILQAILAQVPFDGWTDAAYAQAIKQAGFARGAADKLMPNGIRDAIELFSAWADQAMQARIKAEHGFARLRVRDKIAFAVRARLEFMTPYREAVRRLALWYTLPFNLPLGIRRLAKTVDLMWQAAGDTSTDYNFYTKRVLLSAVLKATIIYWLDDKTPDCQASWEFLDRRISEILKVGKGISLLKEFTPGEVAGFAKRKSGF